MSLSRWISRGYTLPLRRPTVDLWVGGPKADGRGLPAVAGGTGPAVATIVSPTADPGPSGNVRFLQRTNHAAWSPATPLFAPKQPGDLFAAGGRRWTGSGWSYFDAGGAPLGTVEWYGPLPGGLGPSTNVTNTIRRYASSTGLTVADANGGVVHTYSQRCDVASGQTGGGWSVWPCEQWASPSIGDQIIWDSIIELENGRTENKLYAPTYGLYDGSSFLQGTHSLNGGVGGNLPASGSGGTGYASKTQYLGAGPNGGRLWRIVVTVSISASFTTCMAFAYLLTSSAVGYPARSVWIHNHVAYRLTNIQGRWPLAFPPFVMVGVGATPSLSNEDITFPGAFANTTLTARVDLQNHVLDFSVSRLIASATDDVITPIQLTASAYGRYPPLTNYGSIDASAQTVAVSIDAARVTRPYRNGTVGTVPGSPIDDAPGTIAWRIGRLAQNDKRSPLVQFRRLQVYPRVLTAAEHAALHAALVAAET